MPELIYLSALATTIRARHRTAMEDAATEGRPRDAGDIVQYVVITAALAIAAVAIVAIIVAKITSKANSLQTE
ncbi:MAG: hypothetical protein ACT4P1_11160 [Sporichthyaceae bacterium]